MTSHEQRTQAAIAAAGAFGWLARTLWVPLDVAEVTALAEGHDLEHLDAYCATLGVDASDAIEAIRASLVGERSKVVTRLNVESTFIFRVGDGEPPAPPYESVWTSEDKLLFGPATREVVALMREAGLGVNEGAGDLVPDHISRECELLVHIFRQIAVAVDEQDASAAERWSGMAEHFIAVHVRTWWPQFFNAVIDSGRSAFFTAVAGIGLAVLESEDLATALGDPAQ